MSNSYSVPKGLRVYAIGDIHGHLDPLVRLHEEISKDLLRDPPEKVHIVYIGDYIDRGPEGKQVIDFLIERKSRGDGIRKTFIEGNHERTMMNFVKDKNYHDGFSWLKWGGKDTLASYGVTFENDILLPAEIEQAHKKLSAAMPDDHWNFFKGLKLFTLIGDYFFTHAGVDPRKAFDQQSPDALRTIREPFLSWGGGLEFKVVHGHTISKEPENLPHRIGVDTGIWQGGPLTAAVLEGEDVRFLQAGHLA